MAELANDTFRFTAEQHDLRGMLREFLADVSGEPELRRLMETDIGHDPGTWARLGAELGVLGLAVPEALGGADGTLVDQAIAAEEFGRVLLPGPVLGTVYLAMPALLALTDRVAAAELLAPLVAGQRTATLAVPAAGPRFTPGFVRVTERSGSLTGDVGQVVDAATADLLLVAADTARGVALFAVEEAERRPLSTMDLTRRQATVRFDGSPARLLAGPEETRGVLERAFVVGGVLHAAEQVGGAQRLLDLCVAYAGIRLQFGRPIGSFQAVKHRCVDMFVLVEHARSAAYHAAWALRDGTDSPALTASIAQAVCSAAYQQVASMALQVLGGIGFTWEHSAHLYFKRAVTDAVLLGSAAEHRDRIAAMVLDVAEATGAPAVARGARPSALPSCA